MSYLDIARRTLAGLKDQSPKVVEISHDDRLPGRESELCDESDKTDYWWSILTPEEREALKPRPIRRRCPWCKRIEHTAICDELRPKRLMPLGRYKGHPIEGLPRDYVDWLARSCVRLDSETRDEIFDRFGIVINQE